MPISKSIPVPCLPQHLHFQILLRSWPRSHLILLMRSRLQEPFQPRLFLLSSQLENYESYSEKFSVETVFFNYSHIS